MTTKNFINKCKNSGQFNYRQMYEIRQGFEQGLTMEQVEVYAKPEFSSMQMMEVRWGFEDGLTIKQVKVYADPQLDWCKMEQICNFIKENNDIPIKTVKFLIGIDCI